MTVEKVARRTQRRQAIRAWLLAGMVASTSAGVCFGDNAGTSGPRESGLAARIPAGAIKSPATSNSLGNGATRSGAPIAVQPPSNGAIRNNPFAANAPQPIPQQSSPSSVGLAATAPSQGTTKPSEILRTSAESQIRLVQPGSKPQPPAAILRPSSTALRLKPVEQQGAPDEKQAAPATKHDPNDTKSNPVGFSLSDSRQAASPSSNVRAADAPGQAPADVTPMRVSRQQGVVAAAPAIMESGASPYISESGTLPVRTAPTRIHDSSRGTGSSSPSQSSTAPQVAAAREIEIVDSVRIEEPAALHGSARFHLSLGDAEGKRSDQSEPSVAPAPANYRSGSIRIASAVKMSGEKPSTHSPAAVHQLPPSLPAEPAMETRPETAAATPRVLRIEDKAELLPSRTITLSDVHKTNAEPSLVQAAQAIDAIDSLPQDRGTSRSAPTTNGKVVVTPKNPAVAVAATSKLPVPPPNVEPAPKRITAPRLVPETEPSTPRTRSHRPASSPAVRNVAVSAPPSAGSSIQPEPRPSIPTPPPLVTVKATPKPAPKAVVHQPLETPSQPKAIPSQPIPAPSPSKPIPSQSVASQSQRPVTSAQAIAIAAPESTPTKLASPQTGVASSPSRQDKRLVIDLEETKQETGTKNRRSLQQVAADVIREERIFQGKVVESLSVKLADSQALAPAMPVRRVQLENREICEAVLVGPHKLLLIGRTTGSTKMAIWHRDSETPVIREIQVVRGEAAPRGTSREAVSQRLTETLASTFPQCRVRVVPVKDGLTVVGQATDNETASEIMRLVRSACLESVTDQLIVR